MKTRLMLLITLCAGVLLAGCCDFTEERPATISADITPISTITPIDLELKWTQAYRTGYRDANQDLAPGGIPARTIPQSAIEQQPTLNKASFNSTQFNGGDDDWKKEMQSAISANSLSIKNNAEAIKKNADAFSELRDEIDELVSLVKPKLTAPLEDEPAFQKGNPFAPKPKLPAHRPCEVSQVDGDDFDDDDSDEESYADASDCQCSEDCTCGCQRGGDCKCSKVSAVYSGQAVATSAPIVLQPAVAQQVMYTPATTYASTWGGGSSGNFSTYSDNSNWSTYGGGSAGNYSSYSNQYSYGSDGGGGYSSPAYSGGSGGGGGTIPIFSQTRTRRVRVPMLQTRQVQTQLSPVSYNPVSYASSPGGGSTSSSFTQGRSAPLRSAAVTPVRSVVANTAQATRRLFSRRSSSRNTSSNCANGQCAKQ